ARSSTRSEARRLRGAQVPAPPRGATVPAAPPARLSGSIDGDRRLLTVPVTIVHVDDREPDLADAHVELVDVDVEGPVVGLLLDDLERRPLTVDEVLDPDGDVVVATGPQPVAVLVAERHRH